MEAPPPGCYKQNINGAFVGTTQLGGAGGIFRDVTAAWTFGCAKSLYYTSILQAELLAMLLGLRLSFHNNSICPNCTLAEEETFYHMFFKCPRVITGTSVTNHKYCFTYISYSPNSKPSA